MLRTQIQLDENQARLIKEAARLEGVSMSEIIRRCIARALPELTTERAGRYLRARRAIGVASSGAPDVAQRHDAYLEDAFE